MQPMMQESQHSRQPAAHEALVRQPLTHSSLPDANTHAKVSRDTTPFQHVAKVDDKCARNRLDMLPLSLCKDLQPWVGVRGQHSKGSIVCMCARAIHTLQHAGGSCTPPKKTVSPCRIVYAPNCRNAQNALAVQCRNVMHCKTVPGLEDTDMKDTDCVTVLTCGRLDMQF